MLNKPKPKITRTCSFPDVIAYKRQHRPDMFWDAFRNWLYNFWGASGNTYIRLDETDNNQVLELVKGNEKLAACWIELRDEYGADLLWRLD